jgi:hypothetical protein
VFGISEEHIKSQWEGMDLNLVSVPNMIEVSSDLSLKNFLY